MLASANVEGVSDPPVMQASHGGRIVTAFVLSFDGVRTVVAPEADGTVGPILTVGNLTDAVAAIRRLLGQRTAGGVG